MKLDNESNEVVYIDEWMIIMIILIKNHGYSIYP